ncbi:MAG: hypothetical protein ACI9CQ_004270, partial [Saprospiraceae bacterium]
YHRPFINHPKSQIKNNKNISNYKYDYRKTTRALSAFFLRERERKQGLQTNPVFTTSSTITKLHAPKHPLIYPLIKRAD